MAILGLVLLVFVGYALVWPRIVLDRVDAYIARHPLGSSIDAAVRDPLVPHASVAFLGGEADGPCEDHRIPECVAAHPRGTVTFLWTYLAPFGRVGVTFDYDNGVITEARREALD